MILSTQVAENWAAVGAGMDSGLRPLVPTVPSRVWVPEQTLLVWKMRPHMLGTHVPLCCPTLEVSREHLLWTD